MKLAHPELRNRLAAEYVLGTMRGGARRRFAEMAAQDSGLRHEVERWEAHLTPLAERLKPVDAPARVWKKIQERIGAAPAARPAGWWTGLRVHIGIGIASFAAAALLTAGILPLLHGGSGADTMPMMTAVLDEGGTPRMIVEQPKPGMLMVRVVKAWKPAADNSLELWVIPADGAPRSLGLVAADQTTMIHTAELDQRLAGGIVFAVSREPKGGSPTGAPTGPVLCKGVIARDASKPRPQI